MKHQFDLEDNGEVKQITIEPSVYQDKHLYEIHIDDEYIVMYREGKEWKHNQEYGLSPQILEQIIEKVESLKQITPEQMN